MKLGGVGGRGGLQGVPGAAYGVPVPGHGHRLLPQGPAQVQPPRSFSHQTPQRDPGDTSVTPSPCPQPLTVTPHGAMGRCHPPAPPKCHPPPPASPGQAERAHSPLLPGAWRESRGAGEGGTRVLSPPAPPNSPWMRLRPGSGAARDPPLPPGAAGAGARPRGSRRSGCKGGAQGGPALPPLPSPGGQEGRARQYRPGRGW